MAKFDDLTRLLDFFVSRGLPGCGCAVAQRGKILYEAYVACFDFPIVCLIHSRKVWLRRRENLTGMMWQHLPPPNLTWILTPIVLVEKSVDALFD